MFRNLTEGDIAAQQVNLRFLSEFVQYRGIQSIGSPDLCNYGVYSCHSSGYQGHSQFGQTRPALLIFA